MSETSIFVKLDKIVLLDILKKLTKDTKAQWGNMKPQQMIEHLIKVIDISVGNVSFKVVTHKDKIEKYQASLFMDYELPKNFKFPYYKDNKLPDLKHKNLKDAKHNFIKKVDEFFSYYKTNEGVKVSHPIFGDLDYKQWEILHRKHFTHHFKQFNILN